MFDGLFFIMVFFAGMTSFMMPCIIPLIPAYFAFLTGRATHFEFNDPKIHKGVILNSLAFILGFILVFVLLGAAATSLGRLLFENQEIIRKAGGIFIVAMGFFHIGLMPLKFMQYERRFNVVPDASGFLQSMMLGAGFGFGWTPCMGPVLASILIIASQTDTVGMGMLLLSIYGIGLGVPFLALAIGFKVLWKYVQRLQMYAGIIRKITGVMLILIGILIYFNRLMLFAF